jgi:hypothetical protein
MRKKMFCVRRLWPRSRCWGRALTLVACCLNLAASPVGAHFGPLQIGCGLWRWHSHAIWPNHLPDVQQIPIVGKKDPAGWARALSCPTSRPQFSPQWHVDKVDCYYVGHYCSSQLPLLATLPCAPLKPGPRVTSVSGMARLFSEWAAAERRPTGTSPRTRNAILPDILATVMRLGETSDEPPVDVESLWT